MDAARVEVHAAYCWQSVLELLDLMRRAVTPASPEQEGTHSKSTSIEKGARRLQVE